MAINRILTSQPDVQIAIRQLDDEISALKRNIATLQNKLDTIKGNGSSGGGGSVINPISFNGDLTGSNNLQTVVGIQGEPINPIPPTISQILQFDGTKWTPINPPSSAISSLGGDLSGTATSQVVTGIQGDPIDSTQPTSGQILQWNGSAWKSTTLTIPPAITFAGDLSGSTSNQRVVGLQAIPISAVSPTNGQVLQYNGSVWVPTTITVPGGVTFSGDLSGSNSVQTVTGIRGFSVVTGSPTKYQHLEYQPNQWIYVSNLMTANSSYVGWADPSNTYVSYKLIAGSAGNFNIYSTTSGGVDTVIMTAYPGGTAQFPAVLTLNGGATIYNGQMLSFTNSGNTFIQQRIYTDGGGNLVFANQPSSGAGFTPMFFLAAAGGSVQVNSPLTTNGAINANGGVVVFSNKNVAWYNAANTQYAILTWGTSHPVIGSTTGTVQIDNILLLSNAANIQFGGNWVAWTPTVTGITCTATVTSWSENSYCRVGPIVFIQLGFNVTISGAAGPGINVTLPVNRVGGDWGSASCEGSPGAVYKTLRCAIGSTYMTIAEQNNANLAAGAMTVRITGCYRCV